MNKFRAYMKALNVLTISRIFGMPEGYIIWFMRMLLTVTIFTRKFAHVEVPEVILTERSYLVLRSSVLLLAMEKSNRYSSIKLNAVLEAL